MSRITPVKIAAAAVGGYALYAGYKRNKVYQFQAGIKHNYQAREISRNLAQQQYTQGVSGNPHLDNWAKKWRSFKTYGPWGINLHAKLVRTKVSQFVNNVLLTPETAIGLAALYIGGFKPHQVITKPAKFIWQNGAKQAAQSTWTAIKNIRSGRILRGLQKVTRSVFTLPGLLIVGGLGLLAWRFNNVSDGAARVDFFNQNPNYSSYLYAQHKTDL
jgi:hypothetical protein